MDPLVVECVGAGLGAGAGVVGGGAIECVGAGVVGAADGAGPDVVPVVGVGPGVGMAPGAAATAPDLLLCLLCARVLAGLALGLAVACGDGGTAGVRAAAG